MILFPTDRVGLGLMIVARLKNAPGSPVSAHHMSRERCQRCPIMRASNSHVRAIFSNDCSNHFVNSCSANRKWLEFSFLLEIKFFHYCRFLSTQLIGKIIIGTIEVVAKNGHILIRLRFSHNLLSYFFSE